MSFLLHAENTFTRIDRNKQNLFYQTYTSQGLSRSTSLLINCVIYSATIDNLGQAHVIAKNAKGQTYYFSCSTTPTKQLLFEDSPSTYFFNNLQLTYFKDRLHLFYTATNPTTQTTTLLHRIFSVTAQNVETLHVETLIQNFQDKEFSVVSSSDTLFIVFSDQQNVLELKYLQIINDGIKISSFLLSEFPIISFECCVIDEKLHVIYLQNKYGLNELMYFNPTQSVLSHVCNIESLKGLSLFKYFDFLWINYASNEALYTMLSINDGDSFSAPIINSLQKNIHYLSFFSLDKQLLQTNNLFVAISNNIQICTVCSMDIHGFHPTALPNNELDLFLDAMKFKLQQEYLKEYEAAKPTVDVKVEPVLNERVTPTVAYVENTKASPAYNTFDEALLKPPSYSKQPFVLKEEKETFPKPNEALPKPHEIGNKPLPKPHEIGNPPKEESPQKSGPKDFKSLAQSFMQNYNTFDAQPLIKPD
ncbi:hypothetical protein AN639_03380 [Candidatus Epulonipiscium fishelsonii]|nr:hypothetical protein AN639_03380 [Epulopiscium sp. SCG-B05WGA-EpuloA1]